MQSLLLKTNYGCYIKWIIAIVMFFSFSRRPTPITSAQFAIKTRVGRSWACHAIWFLNKNEWKFNFYAFQNGRIKILRMKIIFWKLTIIQHVIIQKPNYESLINSKSHIFSDTILENILYLYTLIICHYSNILTFLFYSHQKLCISA